MSGSRIARGLVSVSIAALAALPAPAAAQHIDRIVAFGDSYADTGIATATMLGDPTAPADLKALLSTLYSTGRFSGGTNYVDTLSDILNVPVENYAVGGARAGTFPVPFGTGTSNNTSCGPGVVAGSAAICPKGFAYEVNQFLNIGAQDPLFPAGSGTTFDEGDLVVVSIGANDARYYQQNYSAFPAAPFIAGSIAGANAGLDQLVAAGAPTISFLAGDTSRLPEVFGDPAAAAIRSAYSSAFNTAMQSTLSGYAADGVIVHYLDLNAVGDRIIADPTLFGLTSAGPCPAAEATRCVTDANFVNQFLFYVDGLHLTSAGFAIVARYVAVQLDAPLTLQAPADLGLDTARQWGRTLTSRIDVNGRGLIAPGLRLFAVGDFFSRDVPESAANHKFDIDGVGGTIGGEYGFGSGLVGLAANYTRPRVSFGSDAAEVDGRSWQIGAYGSFGMGGFFGQGYVGYGSDRHDIERVGVIDELTAEPDGSHVVAGAKAGYLLSLDGLISGLRAGPVAAIDYARAKVDGYTESGDAALTLTVNDQSLKATTGQLGVEGRWQLIEGVSPYFTLVAEREMSGDSRVIRFAQTSAPTIVNLWNVEREKETYGRTTSGASFNLWQGASLNTSISRTFGREGGQEFGAQLGFKTGF
jgi:phospholipase/lecithinase/hemolysin/uncharacterized protein YhjY with autotransporter beta-barrel domain